METPTQMAKTQGSTNSSEAKPVLSRVFDEHPVIRDRARLPTPPVKAVFDVIERTIYQRDPGSSFIAHPRFGKTFAIQVLTKQVCATFPQVPVIIISAKGHARFSEVAFYTEILENCKHSFSGVGKVSARRSRLINYLWTLSQARNSDRIVLFIDEAQNWAEAEFSCLRDLSNDLALNDVRVIALLFGQTELASIRTVLLQSKRTDLIGRFMMQQFEFKGLTSLSDLVETMECYDDVEMSEYPEGSGICYSEYFLPAAFQGGWRLSKEAGRLWAQFEHAAREHGGLKQVGMHWVAACIRSFFVTHIGVDHTGLTGTDADWRQAVAASCFALSLGVTYDADLQLPVNASIFREARPNDCRST